MKSHHKRISKKIGMRPGAVVYVGKETEEPVVISAIDYSERDLKTEAAIDVTRAIQYKETSTMSWINVNGIHDSSLVEQLGATFEIHPLVLEDIVNTGQRPTFDDSKDYVFVTLKMLLGFDDNGDIKSEQVSVLFGKKWVLTFQETGEDVFDSVRQRLIKTEPRVRFMSSDYLAYTLIDAIVDHYFLVLEDIGAQIDAIDDSVSDNPAPSDLESIRKLKKQLIFMRKAVWPMREVISGLDRIENKLITDTVDPYLRDLYEHIVQVIDTIETYRDLVSGLLDLYHTGVSNRMNEIMKVLTIFASIFIPLGFLAGVYGMNFDTSASPFNLPELGLPYGYILFWCLAASIGGGLFLFFRRKKWL